MESPKWLLDDVITSEISWKDAHEALPKLIRYLLGDVKKGAEIGVAYGSMTIALLSEFPELYMNAIDPYIPYDSSDIMSSTIEEQNNVFRYTNSRLLKLFSKRAVLIRDHSINVSKRFQDEELDFVFIDACHQYEAVYADIKDWHPKVKNGGLVCGHDYNTGWIGVTKAVNQFFSEIKKPIAQTAKGNIWVCKK
jgi:predicted O-methyltransferase YrrM